MTSSIHFWKDMPQAALYTGVPAVQKQEASRAALERGSALELINLCNRFSWLLHNTLGVVSISSTAAITSWKLWTENIFFPTWKKRKKKKEGYKAPLYAFPCNGLWTGLSLSLGWGESFLLTIKSQKTKGNGKPVHTSLDLCPLWNCFDLLRLGDGTDAEYSQIYQIKTICVSVLPDPGLINMSAQGFLALECLEEPFFMVTCMLRPLLVTKWMGLALRWVQRQVESKRWLADLLSDTYLHNALAELRHGLVQFLIQKSCLDSHLLSGTNK